MASLGSRLAKDKVLLIAAVFALSCIAIVASRPALTQWSPDCGSKYLQLMSIHFDHGLHFDTPYVGKPFDPDMAAVPLGDTYYIYRDGKMFMTWPALFPLVIWPFQRAFGYFGAFVLPVSCGALCVWLTGVIAERIRAGTGWIAALVVAVVTPVIIYSTLYWEHTIALALELGAFVLVMNYATAPRVWALAVAGALTGMGASGFRGDVAVFALALFGAVFLVARGRDRWLVPVGAGIGYVVGAGPGWFLNYTLHGHLGTPNGVRNTPPPSLDYLNSVHLGIVPHIFVGRAVPATLAWDSTLGLVALAFAYYARRSDGRPWSLIALAVAPVVLAVASVLELQAVHNGRFHGWLGMCPALALGFLRSEAPLAPAPQTARRVVILTTTFVLAMVAVTIALAYPQGFANDDNLEWGPRYWLVIFPLLAVLVAVNHDAFIDAFKFARWPVAARWMARALALSLFIVSLVFVWTGMFDIQHLMREQGDFRTLMLGAGDEPLLTDVFQMSSWVPEVFASRPSFFLRSDQPDRFPPWLKQAVEHGMTSFDLTTFGGADHPFFHQNLEECQCSLAIEEVLKSGFLTLVRVRVASDSTRTSRVYLSHGAPHELYGSIFERYVSLGETGSYLGLPTSNETPVTTWCTGGRAVDFEHGTIEWCPDRGSRDHKTTRTGAPL